jgi:erythromycin esterase-like protein
MADNLLWVQQRESSRGKVFFFAHDGHVKDGNQVPQNGGAWRMAGAYLRSALGPDMVVIGTYFGHGAGFPVGKVPPPPNAGGIEAMFTSLSIPIFIMDLRELPSAGALHNYFHALHETRNGWFGIYNVAPAESYDAILFIEAITPTVPTSKPESRG